VPKAVGAAAYDQQIQLTTHKMLQLMEQSDVGPKYTEHFSKPSSSLPKT